MKPRAPALALALVGLGLLALAIVFWRHPTTLYTWHGLDWSIVALDASIILIVTAALILPRSDVL
jgi:hypothetical protein